MSVVNKMLNDLDARAGLDDEEGAEYQEPPETRRIRYMVMFIGFVVLSAAGYFVYRAMGPEYFKDLYVQAANFVSGKEEQVQQSKKVSVSSKLDEMMPTRAGGTQPDPSTETSEPIPQSQEASEVSVASAMDNVAEEVTATDTNETLTAQMPDDEETPETAEPESDQEVALLPGGRPAPGPDVEPIPDEERPFIQVSDADDQEALIAELYSSAAEAVAAKDVSQAIRIYRQILTVDLRNHEARKKLAVLHYSYDENGAAAVVLNEGIELAPERVDFRLMLARLFYREKKLKEAYAVLAQIEPDVQRNIDYYGLKATVAQELELNAESSHLYGRLVIFEPNRAQWWLGLAISLDRLGQRDGALRAYENAADLRQLSASADDFIRQRILDLGG